VSKDSKLGDIVSVRNWLNEPVMTGVLLLIKTNNTFLEVDKRVYTIMDLETGKNYDFSETLYKIVSLS